MDERVSLICVSLLHFIHVDCIVLYQNLERVRERIPQPESSLFTLLHLASIHLTILVAQHCLRFPGKWRVQKEEDSNVSPSIAVGYMKILALIPVTTKNSVNSVYYIIFHILYYAYTKCVCQRSIRNQIKIDLIPYLIHYQFEDNSMSTLIRTLLCLLEFEASRGFAILSVSFIGIRRTRYQSFVFNRSAVKYNNVVKRDNPSFSYGAFMVRYFHRDNDHWKIICDNKGKRVTW